MFGTNEIVGQKYFTSNKNANDGQLFVTSIFYTLQGEGPCMGMPAVFVRLAKCNLNCSFCDTFFDDGDWLTVEEINLKIFQVVQKTVNMSSDIHEKTYETTQVLKRSALVLTGGEPMLQANLVELIQTIGCNFNVVQIESNGLLWQDIPETVEASDTAVILVVSPKCSEKSGKYLNINTKVADRVDALKFVVSSDPLSPYHMIPEWAQDLKDNAEDRFVEIYVSPMNIYNDVPRESKQLRLTTNQTSIEQRSEIDEVVSFWTPDLLNREQNQLNHEYAAKYAMQNGLRLNLQMHLYASLA